MSAWTAPGDPGGVPGGRPLAPPGALRGRPGRPPRRQQLSPSLGAFAASGPRALCCTPMAPLIGPAATTCRPAPPFLHCASPEAEARVAAFSPGPGRRPLGPPPGGDLDRWRGRRAHSCHDTWREGEPPCPANANAHASTHVQVAPASRHRVCGLWGATLVAITGIAGLRIASGEEKLGRSSGALSTPCLCDLFLDCGAAGYASFVPFQIRVPSAASRFCNRLSTPSCKACASSAPLTPVRRGVPFCILGGTLSAPKSCITHI